MTVDAFAILGSDATGLGGVEIGADELAYAEDLAAASAALNARSLAETAQAARMQLAQLAAQGYLPGGQAALSATLARLDRLDALDGVALAAGAGIVTGAADCGGAIYVRGASLRLTGRLLDKDTEPNVASRTGLGATVRSVQRQRRQCQRRGDIDEQHASSGAPAFADAANADFHLLPGSAALGAGDPVGVTPAPPVDSEGFPRPFDPRVDIGAYEWHEPQLFLPVITR